MRQTTKNYANAFDKLIAANQQITEQYCGDTVSEIQRLLDSNKKNFQLIDDMRPICVIQRNRCDDIKNMQARRDPVLREAYEKLEELVQFLERCQLLTCTLAKEQGATEQVELLETYVEYNKELQKHGRYADLPFFKQVCTEMHLQTKKTLQTAARAFSKRLSEQCRPTTDPIARELEVVLDSVTQMLPTIVLTKQFDRNLYRDMKRLVVSELHFYINGSIMKTLPPVLIPLEVEAAEYRQVSSCLRISSLNYGNYSLLGDSVVQLEGHEFGGVSRILFDIGIAMLRLCVELGPVFPQTAPGFMCVPCDMFLKQPNEIPTAETLGGLLGLVFCFLCSPSEAVRHARALQTSSPLLAQSVNKMVGSPTESPFTKLIAQYAQSSPLAAFYCLAAIENASLAFSELGIQIIADLSRLYFAPSIAAAEEAIAQHTERESDALRSVKASIYQTGVVEPTLAFSELLNDSYVSYLHGAASLSEASSFPEFAAFSKALSALLSRDAQEEQSIASSSFALSGEFPKFSEMKDNQITPPLEALQPFYEESLQTRAESFPLGSGFCLSCGSFLSSYLQYIESVIESNRSDSEKYGDAFRALNGGFVLSACAPLLAHPELSCDLHRLRSWVHSARDSYARAELLHHMPWARFLEEIKEVLAEGFPRAVVSTRPRLLRADAEAVISQISNQAASEAESLFSRVKKQICAAQAQFQKYSQAAVESAIKSAKNALADAIVTAAVDLYKQFATEIAECYGAEIRAFPPEVQLVRGVLLTQKRVQFGK